MVSFVPARVAVAVPVPVTLACIAISLATGLRRVVKVWAVDGIAARSNKDAPITVAVIVRMIDRLII
jgi:hypothetical protein